MSNKGLFIFFGEFFREGETTSRLRDTQFGYENQKECCESHMKLVKTLKEKYRIEIDIAINTYETIYKNDLHYWYQNHLIYANFVTTNYNSIEYAVQNTILNVMDNVNIDNYDFLFICRGDLLLKDAFIHIFDPFVYKITYPNIEYIQNKCYSISFPQHADHFCIIPKKYFYSMEHSPNNEILPIINHEITAHSHLIPIPSVHWKGIRENALFFLFHQAVGALMILGLSLQKDIGFITDRLYPANTAQQKNPFWKINSRPEAEDDSRGYSETLRYIQTINEVMDISTQTIIQFPKGILHL